MVVIPAIDLYNQKVVRMIKGKKAQKIFYDFDPLDLIERFLITGFKLIHVIDLSKAIDGDTANFELLREFYKRGYSRYIQIGGGIRSIDYSSKLRELGFKRQIITSMLVKNPFLVSEFSSKDVEVIFSLDTQKRTELSVSGWTDVKEMNVFDFLKLLKNEGIKEVIHTDTSVDGTLKGRNLDFTVEITEKTDLEVIIAGGVSSVKDLEKVKEVSKRCKFIKGVIVGRAFYEGLISLEEMKDYAG